MLKYFSIIMKKLAIFDLDGTLLNTVEDLGDATNYALRMCGGFPEYKTGDYYMMVGNGIYKLFERALPEEKRTKEMVAKMASFFLPYYDAHMCDKTVPYPGIDEMIHEISSAGVKVALASNKYQAGCEKLIRHFFSDIPFVKVCGQREGFPLKPDPKLVEGIMEVAGTERKDVVYSGDSGVDMQTGANAKVDTVGVLWGFRSREELEKFSPWRIASSPIELKDWILE